jgi:hypothetical protein
VISGTRTLFTSWIYDYLQPHAAAVKVAHEDFYDQDFCIYNDVFVHAPDQTISIFVRN